MKKPMKRVIALRGEYQQETITQEQLRDLEAAQRAEWLTAKKAALLSERIKAAMLHGAVVEDGELYFDQELEMVRTKRRELA